MKKLISKNPVELFKTGIRFAQRGTPLNMSKLYRRSDGTYTTVDGTVVGYWKGKRLGISGLAWRYLAGKYGKEYANNANANMVNGNIYQGGKWRANYEPSGNKTADWETATGGKTPTSFKDKRDKNHTVKFNIKPENLPLSKTTTKSNLTTKLNTQNKLLLKTELNNLNKTVTPPTTALTYTYDPNTPPTFDENWNNGFFSSPLFAAIAPWASGFINLNSPLNIYGANLFAYYTDKYGSNLGKWLISPYKQGGSLPKYQRGAKFMGTGVQRGWTRSYGNNLWNGITADLKLALIGTGKFTEDSFKDARSLQTALNKYFEGNAATMRNRDDNSVSSIAVDNKWGDLSLKALMHALSMANYDEARPLNVNNVNPVNAPLNGMFTIPTKIEARPEHIYNRAEIRQLLRNQGINPYSLSGAQRQAIRFALNGGHEYNKALLHGIDLKKLTQPVTVANKEVSTFNTLSVPNSGTILTKPVNSITLPTILIKDPGRIPTVPVAKLGGKLISKDPVKLFKLGGSIAKYGLGDRMTSYVKKKKSELNRARAAANSWSGYELTYPEFTQNGIIAKGIVSDRYHLPEVTVKANKEGARKARLTEASKKNSAVANMLDFLYKNKFFDNNIDYHTAVDGIIGDKTKNAIKKAQQLGYVIDQKTGKITKPTQSVKKQTKPVQNPKPIENPRENSLVTNLFNKVGNWFTNLFDKDTVTNSPYTPSNNRNLQAVIDHKINMGVKEPYFYVDKNNGTMYKLQGDKIILKFNIATGVNSGLDGWATLSRDSVGKPVYDRSLNSSSTPAGVFTLGRKMTLYKEPAYRLIEAGTNRWTPSVVHAPATKQRGELLAKGNHFLTYGCIQLPNGQTSCLGNPESDTLYVEPSVPGNYLYEDSDGKIKTHFKNTSSTATGTVWGKNFSRNDVKYNTGY